MLKKKFISYQVAYCPKQNSKQRAILKLNVSEISKNRSSGNLPPQPMNPMLRSYVAD